MSNLLTCIIESKFCIGCGLCASMVGHDSIEMLEGDDGFIVPRQKVSNVDFTFLRDVCPGITLKQKCSLRGPESIYGHYESLYTAYSTDQQIRWKASSGGCITALLAFLIETGTVDEVLHVGKLMDSPLRSSAFASKTRDATILGAGSRYAPSSLLYNWVKLLRTGKKIAVVGKPCDIAGVSQYLDVYPEYKEQVICKISFLCMGLPSQNATKRLIDLFGLNEDEVQDFWYRGNGWPGMATVVAKDGRRFQLSYDDSWGTVLCKDVHFRCKICPDGFGSFADISCGDAWYTRNGRPNFDEQPGRSLAFIRTPVGQEIFNAAVKQGNLVVEHFNVNDLKVIQKSQYHRKQYVGIRVFALKVLGDHLLTFSGFKLTSNLRQTSIRKLVKEFLGTIRRRLSA